MKKQIKKIAKTLSLTVALGAFSQPTWASEELPEVSVSEIFSEQEQHCVAYRVKKVMFIFKEFIVVGKNCRIKTRLETSDQQAQLTVLVPWSTFDSQDQDRDENVAEDFNAEKYPNIVFTSDWISFEELKQALQSGEMKITGKLDVSGSTSEVEVSTFVEEKDGKIVVETTLFTTFPTIQVEAPSAPIFSIQDDLQLYGRFQISQIEGLEELLQ